MVFWGEMCDFLVKIT